MKFKAFFRYKEKKEDDRITLEKGIEKSNSRSKCPHQYYQLLDFILMEEWTK